MIGKLSSHLGPSSIFSGGGSLPSLVLHLDAGNPLSYPPSGFTVSGGGTAHIIDKQVGQDWNAYTPDIGLGEYYFQGGYFQDSATPSGGWYMVDEDGYIRQVLTNSVWFSNGNPTPITNGAGWFMILDGPWTVSNTSSNVTFYEELPTVTPLYDGGLNWFDLTNYNNDGVFQSNPVYSTRVGGNFEFDPNIQTNYVTFPGLTAIPIGDSHYTIETWVKGTGNSGIISWGDPVQNKMNALRFDSSDKFINYWWSNDLYTNSLILSSQNFYHVVAKYNGTEREIWVNGILANRDTPGHHEVERFDNLSVAVSNIPYNEYLYGSLATLKVYNKALSSYQITSSFENTRQRFGYEYGSFTFDSSASQSLYSTSNDYSIGFGDFTIEAFFKTATQSGYDGILSLCPQSTQRGSRITINSGVLEFSTSFNNSYTSITVSNNKWYHVAMSRNSGTVSCFVNGQLQNQYYDLAKLDGTELVIGRYYTDTDDHYIDGLITGIRVINGISIYDSSFNIPDSALGLTTSTVFLINPIKNCVHNGYYDDLSGLVGINEYNPTGQYGWTSSLPSFYEFNYQDFSSTTGLDLVGIYQVSSNQIYLTDIVNSDVGNLYWSTSTNYNRSFSLEFNFECGGGNGADGFCVQWTNTNNTNGGVGGDVGGIYSAHNLFQFKTWSNNNIEYWHNGSSVSTQNIAPFTFRQNAYYWMDYNHDTSTMNIYYSTSNTKPGSATHTFNSVTFDSSSYYLGFGAACGGSNDYHILKSMKLQFTS